MLSVVQCDSYIEEDMNVFLREVHRERDRMCFFCVLHHSSSFLSQNNRISVRKNQAKMVDTYSSSFIRIKKKFH